MNLSGPERGELNSALLVAYPDEDSLRRMLDLKLSRNLDTIAVANSLEDIVYYLTKKADTDGWLDHLIEAAHEQNPGNKKLQTFYQKYKQRQAEQAQKPPVVGEHTEYEPATMKPPQKGAEDAQEHPTSDSFNSSEVDSEELLEEEGGTISKVHRCVEDAYAPFESGIYVRPVLCDEAIIHLETANKHLQEEFCNQLHISSTDPSDSASDDISLTEKLDLIIEEIDDLILSIEKFRKPKRLIPWEQTLYDHQKIKDQFDTLLQNLKELGASIES